MINIIKYSFDGNEVAFEQNDGIMINATEMAKPFGKQPKDWLRTEQAQSIITAVSVRQKCLTADLVKVIQGGTPEKQGTWFQEDVALVFAQWLSPVFYLWCNDRIKEILSQKPPQWYIEREVSKRMRRTFTDSIQESGENERLHGFAYSIYTNMIYKTLFGMNAKQLREYLNIDKKANIKDNLPDVALKKINMLETMSKSLLDNGCQYANIKIAIKTTITQLNIGMNLQQLKAAK